VQAFTLHEKKGTLILDTIITSQLSPVHTFAIRLLKNSDLASPGNERLLERAAAILREQGHDGCSFAITSLPRLLISIQHAEEKHFRLHRRSHPRLALFTSWWAEHRADEVMQHQVQEMIAAWRIDCSQHEALLVLVVQEAFEHFLELFHRVA
jgi:hypothetical protein